MVFVVLGVCFGEGLRFWVSGSMGDGGLGDGHFAFCCCTYER